MWKHNTIFVGILSLLFLVSCHIKPGGVLNEDKMTQVLTEIHQTEGVLQTQGIDYNTPEVKKQYYNQILKKYKISEAVFDSSLVWYTKHPKEFGQVYNGILANIDTLNNQVQRGKFHPDEVNGTQETDLWKLRTKYVFTKDTVRNAVYFEIPNTNNLMVGDIYKLSFLRKIAPADSSINPYVVLRINYLNGKKDSIYVKAFNDNLLKRYTLTFKARDTLKIKSLDGSLLGVRKIKGKQIGRIDSITLIRKFNIYQQEKLKKRVELLDKTKLTSK